MVVVLRERVASRGSVTKRGGNRHTCVSSQCSGLPSMMSSWYATADPCRVMSNICQYMKYNPLFLTKIHKNIHIKIFESTTFVMKDKTILLTKGKLAMDFLQYLSYSGLTRMYYVLDTYHMQNIYANITSFYTLNYH